VKERLGFSIPQHGVRGRRRVDRKNRMVMRPSDLEIASQSEIRLPISASNFSFQLSAFACGLSPADKITARYEPLLFRSLPDKTGTGHWLELLVEREDRLLRQTTAPPP
jgi:hypothetical protein